MLRLCSIPDQQLQRVLGRRVLAGVQRPDETAALEVEDDRIAVGKRSSRDAVVVPRHVAEDLQRQPERLGEERRDAVVGALGAGEDLPDQVALVVGVRPVLEPAPPAEHRVEEAGDVADGVDVGGDGVEPLVDDHAVVDDDPAPAEERDLRLDADADNCKPRADRRSFPTAAKSR